jgi:tRNA(Ile)-lysidine synthase
VASVGAMPSLDPAVAAVRRAVRVPLETRDADGDPAVIVALSGGADSLALAAATAFEAPKLGFRAIAVTVDHGLQPGSSDVAARAADGARALGLAAEVVTVEVGTEGGPEAAAREARYAALADAAHRHGASAVLLGHTLDDQAESVLLGLARGSGAASLAGMAAVRRDDDAALDWLRPLLAVRRAATRAACLAQDLVPWDDPHNADPAFARVRVRERVMPVLESELGPGIAEALARTAEQLREDADALGHLAEEVAEDLAEHAEAGISLPVAALASNPPALRHRLIRLAVRAEFDVALTRAQTLEVARLVTDWHGQGPVHLPGVRAGREAGSIVFSAAS